MRVDNHLLVNQIFAPDREVIIPCNEIQIATCDQEVAVWRKNEWHRRRANEIGDAMEVLRVHHRKIIEQELDVTWFTYGLSMRQEFDEVNNRMMTYLYKFSKDPQDIEDANNYIKQFLPSASISIKDRFVVVEWLDQEHITVHQLIELLTPWSIMQAISFLQWVFVPFGSATREENVLHNFVVHIPLTWPIAMRQDLISKVISILRDYWIYTHHQLTQQRDGQLLQITISDREYLQYGLWFMDHERKATISKLETNEHQMGELYDRLVIQKAPDDLLTQLSDSVLKTVKK